MKVLSWKHPRFDTPWGSLIIATILLTAFSFFDFAELVSLNNLMYSSLLVIDYFSLIRLRYTKPDLYRPYKIGSNTFTILLCVPPLALCVYIMVCAAYYQWIQFVVFLGTWIIGFIIYIILKWKRGKAVVLLSDGESDSEGEGEAEREGEADKDQKTIN